MNDIYQKAFTEAFTIDDLKQLTKYGLDVDLDRISQLDTRETAVFDLLTWARRSDSLARLVAYAKTQTTNAHVLDLPNSRQGIIEIPSRSAPTPERYFFTPSKDSTLLNYTVENNAASLARVEEILLGNGENDGLRSVVATIKVTQTAVVVRLDTIEHTLLRLSLTVTRYLLGSIAILAVVLIIILFLRG